MTSVIETELCVNFLFIATPAVFYWLALLLRVGVAKTSWEERNGTSVAKTFAMCPTRQSVIVNKLMETDHSPLAAINAGSIITLSIIFLFIFIIIVIIKG